MTFTLSNTMIGIIAVVAGILILIFPAVLAWIIGIFLIVYGILILLGRKLQK